MNAIVLEYILFHYISIISKCTRDSLPKTIKSQQLAVKNYSQNPLFIIAGCPIYEKFNLKEQISKITPRQFCGSVTVRVGVYSI